MTPSGIEPTTCRFVAWCLNHYATARPQKCAVLVEISQLVHKKVGTPDTGCIRKVRCLLTGGWGWEHD
jgi:hypothetical protein